MRMTGRKRRSHIPRATKDGGVAGLKSQIRDLRESCRSLALGYKNSLAEARRSARRIQRSSAFTRAAFWALRASSIGWALVCGRRVVVTNPAFARLGGTPRGTRWRALDAATDGARLDEWYSSLRDVVIAESARLDRGRARTRRRFTNGERVVVEVASERSRVRPNEPAALVFIQDVTALAKAEADVQMATAVLLQQERLRTAGELAIGIGHDVNNILAALSLRLEPLLRDEEYRDRYGSNLQALKRIVAEGKQLVGKLRRIGHGEESTITCVDLRETVDAAIEIAQSGLRLRGLETGVQIRFQSHLPELPKVAGFADELRHVFVNLFINARDAMPNGGTISVSGRVELGGIIVTVEDEGSGIEPSDLPHLFDVFFTTKGAKGTGMGLALARAVMERLGGAVSAKNRPNGGAAFELRFLPFGQRPRPTAYPSGTARPKLPDLLWKMRPQGLGSRA